MTNPNDIGEWRPDPWRGWLVFSYLPSDLQAGEDSAHELDYRNARTYATRQQRPATDVERTLLAHIGFDGLPTDLTTYVDFPAVGLWHRAWPQLLSASAAVFAAYGQRSSR